MSGEETAEGSELFRLNDLGHTGDVDREENEYHQVYETEFLTVFLTLFVQCLYPLYEFIGFLSGFKRLGYTLFDVLHVVHMFFACSLNGGYCFVFDEFF